MTQTGVVYVYSLAPMDFGWDVLPTLDEYVRRLLGAEHGLGHSVPALVEALENATDLVHWAGVALEAAKESAGWEGDFRHGSQPRVFCLPDGDDGLSCALVWKQDNNGTTFVASPHLLPHLGRPDGIAEDAR